MCKKSIDKTRSLWYTKDTKKDREVAMMNTLYTMVGLPASGKSTYTEAHKECVVVSTDAIREELLGSAENQERGAEVFAEAHRRVAQALAEGHDVIIDATNVTRKARKQWTAHKARHVAVYVATDKEECKRRNAQRQRHVPTDVIDRMSQRLTIPTEDEGFEEIIIL